MKKGLSNASASILAILAGLAAGLVILFITNPQNAFQGLIIIIKGGWNNGLKGVGQVMYHATPIIMTGLSVGFAFKTGMFNIGAVGQLMVGGFTAIYVGVTWTFLPGALHWITALIMGMLAGMAWGIIVGLFKALLNVNEVITSIMLNYIGMYLINFTIKNSHLYDPFKNQTVDVAASAVLPKGGLDNLFFILKGRFRDVSSVNAGFYIAVGFAILIYIILTRTTFGYELKAVGHNRFASRYAGISGKRAIVSAMAIAGGLSGVAGALMYLAPTSGMHMHVEEVLAAQGFNGIAVALLGLSNPIGIVFTGIFIAHLTEAGRHLQSLRYMKEIIDVIIGLIIYFSAFSLLARDFLAGRKRKQAAIIAAGQDADYGEEEA
ncbi:MAG: ABC transporter permease [Eubacteriales bacterium]|nr:ABC transporter permease [Eubacteriales bacterium]